MATSVTATLEVYIFSVLALLRVQKWGGMIISELM